LIKILYPNLSLLSSLLSKKIYEKKTGYQTMWFLKLSLTMQHGLVNPKAFLSLSLSPSSEVMWKEMQRF
jgi:hypothetical protein